MRLPQAEVTGGRNNAPTKLSLGWAFLILSDLAFGLAAGWMATVFILGRAHPFTATRNWLGALAVLALLASAWQLYFTFRLLTSRQPRAHLSGRWMAGIVIALTGAASAVTAGAYLSDNFNHEFTVEPAVRSASAIGAALLVYLVHQLQSALLTSQYPGRQFGLALIRQMRQQGRLVAPLASAMIGLLVGTSYITVVGDDYARYWTIADALTSGWGYPVSEVGPQYVSGGLSPYLIDLPALPVAMIVSFGLLGHNVLGAMAPAILGSSLFGLMAYLALKELTGRVLIGFVGAAAISTFPFLSFYVIRSGEPDGIFLTLLMAMAYLGIRCYNHPANRWSWPAFGLFASLAALTRPEGVAYLGIPFLFLGARYWRSTGYWVAAGVAGLLLAPFVLAMLTTFGTPWPTSFAGTVRPEHALQNLEGFFTWGLPRYSAALAIPEPILLLLAGIITAFYIVGTTQLARRAPGLLFLALLPAVSIAMFLLASPALTRPQIPYDFFRRASYGLPYLAMVALYPVARSLTGSLRLESKRLIVALLVIVSVLAISHQVRLWAEPEEIYPLKTQILTSGIYVLATDLQGNRYEMPTLPFEKRQGKTMVATSFDYMSFRDGLNGSFKPVDLHGSNRGRGYATAALAIFLVGLCYALAVQEEPNEGEDGTRVARRLLFSSTT